LLLFIIFIAACSGVAYETFYSQEDDPLFTFQFPSDYRVVYEPLPSDVVLIEITKKNLVVPPLINISAEKIDGQNLNDLKNILESHILNISKIEKDFKVLQRGIVFISGIEAQYIVYSVTSYHDKETDTSYGRVVIFNHNGMIWTIYASNGLDMIEEFEGVFTRILYTFKFLD
jgi:hypothetical protein